MELENRDECKIPKFIEAGVMIMAGVIAGLIVCAFVYVIRESLIRPEEEL
jgi:hypothetical protein